MLSSPHLIDFFPDNEVFDLGYDVLPNIIGKASGYVIEDYLIDIGTIEKLKQAEKDIENKIFIIKNNKI